jgi:Leucine-rich repeat (LRR) protein
MTPINFKMKYIIILFTVSVFFQANAQKIKFKDSNLKKALIELGYDRNKNSEIEVSEIDTVQKLKVSKRNIKSLDDMIYFKNLKELNVMTNDIKEIKVFYGNSTIEELYVGENKLGPKLIVKDMPNLKGIYAFRNDITEFEFIGEFPKLRSLYIQGNPVVNLDLQNLKNLENLQLFECDKLKTIDLWKKTKIKQFFLMDMKVVNVVSKNEFVRTAYIEKNSDPKNSPKIDSVKTAPVIKITKDMIITPNK